MKSIFLAIILILLVESGRAQQLQWQHLHGPVGESISLISASDRDWYAATGTNLYHSSDSGFNWTVVRSMTTGMVSTLASHGSIVAVGFYDHGLMWSVDAGQTWDSLSTILAIRSVSCSGHSIFLCGDTCLRSDDSGKTWRRFGPTSVRTGEAIFVGSNKAILATNNYLYLSEDTGRSWRLADTVLPANAFARAIKVNSDTIVIGWSDATIRISTDDGITWRSATHPPEISDAQNMSVLNGVIFIDGVRSTDFGVTWVTLPRIGVFQTVVTQDGIASASCDGVWFSQDAGLTWMQRSNGLGYKNVYSIAGFGKVVFAAGSCGGIMRSTDNGVSWKKLDTLRQYPIRRLFCIDSTIFASFYCGFIASSDSENTWHSLTAQLRDSCPIVIAHEGHNILYFGSSELSKSTFFSNNLGKTWREIDTAIKPDFMSMSGGTIFVHQRDVIGPAYFYQSTDSGWTWQQSLDTLNGADFESMIVFDSIRIVAKQTRFWVSSGLDSSWTPISAPLIFTLVRAGQNLFAVGQGDQGHILYFSPDSGKSWTPESNGAEQRGVNYEALFAIGNRLYLGTREGIYVADISAVRSAVIDDHSIRRDLQLYPNPSSFWAYLTNDEGGVLSITDALGRVIRHANVSPNYELNIIELPDGIYTIQLKTATQTQSTMLVVSR
jgi:photosystem II stability/assembly factor-like uncharacterized protein